MEIDHFLPKYDFSEKHDRLVNGTPRDAYDALQKIDLSQSTVIRFLLWLRGLKLRTFEQIRNRFLLLHDEPSKEIVMGLIAQPWKLDEGILPISKDQFLNFNEPNYAKAVWNFTFEQIDNKTLVSTETRIQCTDQASKNKFRVYWFFIRPFSGLIRIEMLRLLKKKFE